MSRFIKIPPLSIGRSGQWVLTGELQYYSSLLEAVVIVPHGFETDLASIPRLFTWLIPKNGSHRAAAIVHDYIYSMQGEFQGLSIGRKMCDRVFLEAMKACGVSSWQRSLMYSAVRAGGWAPWKNYIEL